VLILFARNVYLAAERFLFIQLDFAISPHPPIAPYPALYSGFAGLTVRAGCEIASAFGLLGRWEPENATKDGLE
jgi:hypothetical protein